MEQYVRVMEDGEKVTRKVLAIYKRTDLGRMLFLIKHLRGGASWPPRGDGFFIMERTDFTPGPIRWFHISELITIEEEEEEQKYLFPKIT